VEVPGSISPVLVKVPGLPGAELRAEYRK